jgi:hypothetical protein
LDKTSENIDFFLIKVCYGYFHRALGGFTMIKKRYPTRNDRGAFLDKLRKISGKGLAGLALLAVASLAPRCGGVIEGHATRSSQISKNETRVAISTARRLDSAGPTTPAKADAAQLNRGEGR